MESFKSLINYISNPTILVTAVLLIFPFVFPPTEWFYKINKRLKMDKLWTGKGLFVMTAVTIAFFIFGLGDYNFQKIVLKPDNVPISGLILLLIFFTWLSMSQAYKNDKLVETINRRVDTLFEREKVNTVNKEDRLMDYIVKLNDRISVLEKDLDRAYIALSKKQKPLKRTNKKGERK